MPYTLLKGLAWVVAALLVGGVIGWMLRSLTSRRQVARARAEAASAATVDAHTADRAAGHLESGHGLSEDVASGVGSAGSPDAAELARLRVRLAELEPIVVERDRLRAEVDASRAARAARAAGAAGTGAAADAPAPPDVAAAAAVLDRTIVLDDLRAVEGIGPAIERLCHGIGIRTWWDLASTETSLLRTMLTDAGPSYAADDPSTWPEQARLLAEGRWAELKTLTDALSSGRRAD